MMSKSSSALCRLLAFAACLLTFEARAVSTWRTIADARANNGVFMLSATEGWAVGDIGSVSHTTDGGTTWTEMTSNTSSNLYSVWAADASNVWAVGTAGTIMYWNGVIWAQVIPAPTAKDLLSVRGISATAVWAVGKGGVLLKWDGTSWTQQTAPAGLTTNDFYGVWAADASNIWAVGAGGKIIKNDGTAWTAQTSGTAQQINAVWGTSATNVYAVGVPTTGPNAGTFLHWNGTAWTLMNNNVPATGTYISITGADASHIWAVAAGGAVRFYSGSGNWSAQTSNATQVLTCVAAGSSSRVVAVGYGKTYDVYDGATWAPKQAATPLVTNSATPIAFNAAWGPDDNKVFFVGQAGNIVRWDGGGNWTVTSSPVTQDLNAVWGVDEKHVWAVGAGGKIVFWNGTAWTAQTAPAGTPALNSVYGVSTTTLWAVGANGRIIYTLDGGNLWITQTTPAGTPALYGVWASDANNAWAVGDKGANGNGTILKYTSGSWVAQSSNQPAKLNRIWGASAGAIWAVGDSSANSPYYSIILKSTNGSTWALQSSGIGTSLASVCGVNTTNQWTVGGGNILHGTGTAWAADGNVLVPVPLIGAFATGVSSVFLTGSNGLIFLNSPALVPEVEVELTAGMPLSPSTAAVDFGMIAQPTQAVPLRPEATKTFTIRNTGTADLTGLGVTVDGTNSADFLLTAPLATTLAPGASTTFTVTLSPLKEGLRKATLHVASNDLDRFNFLVSLTGTGEIPPVITVQPKPTSVNPGKPVTLSVTATGTAQLLYQWRKNGGNLPGENSPKLIISSASKMNNEGSYDVVITNPATVLTGVPTVSTAVQLTVNEGIVLMSGDQPVAQSATVGSTVSFAVTTTLGTAPITYQWRKAPISNAAAVVNIAGATSATYTIPNVQTSNAGFYSVVLKNAVGSVTSSSVSLNVADTTPKVIKVLAGTTATLPAAFGGGFSSFAWTKVGGMGTPLNDPRITGLGTTKLTIAKSQLMPTDDSGTYTCEGTVVTGNLTATLQLILYKDAPVIDMTSAVAGKLVLPNAIVGGVYAGYTIPVDSSTLKIPTGFTVTGLPTGLKVDANTGIITGTPTVALAADKTYTLTITASNAKGKSTATGTLLVKADPYGTVGLFAGPIARENVLTKGLGGRVDITTTTAGGFTGTVRLGATTYSVLTGGALNVDITGMTKSHGVATIKRTAPALPLTLSFDIDTSTTDHMLINGDITDGTAHATFTAWRKKWGTIMPAPEQADLNTYLGYYTFGLDIPAAQDGVESVPQGMSYGSFTVAAGTGNVVATGKLADGTVFTSSTFAGPQGQVVMFQPLYANLGSIAGSLNIVQGTAMATPAYSDNKISGTVSWLHPLVTTTSYNYKAGFGPMDLTAFGGRYVAPVSPAVVMGLTDDGTTNNAKLVFTQGGISGTSTDMLGTAINPGISVRIKAGGAVVRPTTNPDLTTLTITPSTGAITGTFKLVDTNPAAAGNITRSVTYYGMIIPDAGVLSGQGFFLLQRRPIPTVPPAKAQTLATCDLLSGLVQLQKLVVVP